MISSFLRPVFLGFIALALIGTGCNDGSLLGDCVTDTPWGSCIDQNGIDEALLGPWVLQSQTVSTGDGTVTNPFSGRVTSFSVGTFDLSPVLRELFF